MTPEQEQQLDFMTRLEAGKLKASEYIDEEIWPTVKDDILSDDAKELVHKMLLHFAGGAEALAEMCNEHEKDLWDLRGVILNLLDTIEYCANQNAPMSPQDKTLALRLVVKLRRKLGASA